MELKCSKSAANWFDDLSVMNVKIVMSNDNYLKEKNRETFEKLGEEIRIQVGDKLYRAILESKEYRELFKLNEEIFELIDLLRQTKSEDPHNYKLLSKCGVKIDKKNTERFFAKKELQSRFFDSEIKEIKL